MKRAFLVLSQPVGHKGQALLSALDAKFH